MTQTVIESNAIHTDRYLPYPSPVVEKDTPDVPKKRKNPFTAGGIVLFIFLVLFISLVLFVLGAWLITGATTGNFNFADTWKTVYQAWKIEEAFSAIGGWFAEMGDKIKSWFN